MNELPDYVWPLSSGTFPTDDADVLDAAAMDDIDRQIREIGRSRAAAELSGRNYICGGDR